VKDRARCRVHVKATGRTRPVLPLLLGRVASEHPLDFAPLAERVLTIGSEPCSPQPLQAGLVIGEVLRELKKRVLRVRPRCVLRVLAVTGGHESSMTRWTYTVKGYLPRSRAVSDVQNAKLPRRPEGQPQPPPKCPFHNQPGCRIER